MIRETWELFKGHEGDAKEHAESITTVMDSQRMADSYSVVHLYYYHDHNTWLQIYSKLRRGYGCSGKLSRMCYDQPDSPYRCSMENVKFFPHHNTCQMLSRVHAGTYRTLPEDFHTCKAVFFSSTLSLWFFRPSELMVFLAIRDYGVSVHQSLWCFQPSKHMMFLTSRAYSVSSKQSL